MGGAHLEVFLRKGMETMKKADLKRENDTLWRDVLDLGEQLKQERELAKLAEAVSIKSINQLRDNLADLRARFARLTEAHLEMTKVLYPGSLTAQNAPDKYVL